MRIKSTSEDICRECGTTTVAWEEERIVKNSLQFVPCKRDYYPVTFSVHLKTDTTTTYIVTPELEKVLREQPFSRIRSMDEGASEYTIDVPLPKDGRIQKLLSEDGRIDEWHTETSAPVCDSHANFVDKRY